MSVIWILVYWHLCQLWKWLEICQKMFKMFYPFIYYSEIAPDCICCCIVSYGWSSFVRVKCWTFLTTRPVCLGLAQLQKSLCMTFVVFWLLIPSTRKLLDCHSSFAFRAAQKVDYFLWNLWTCCALGQGMFSEILRFIHFLIEILEFLKIICWHFTVQYLAAFVSGSCLWCK